LGYPYAAKEGIEVIQMIRRQTGKVAILIWIDDTNSKFAPELLLMSVNGVLSKNADLAELENAIDSMLSRGRYINRDLVETGLSKGLTMRLSNREAQLLTMIKKGMTNKEIAKSLQLRVVTVEGYRKKLMAKTNSKNMAALISFGFRIFAEIPVCNSRGVQSHYKIILHENS
jgi:DNA-binding NarL/FixJ family response regulator